MSSHCQVLGSLFIFSLVWIYLPSINETQLDKMVEEITPLNLSTETLAETS